MSAPKDSMHEIHEITAHTLNSTKSTSDIELQFESGQSYIFCLTNLGTEKQHVYFDFPLVNAEATGSKFQIDEGVRALEALGQEIDQASQTVRESIEKTTIFDATYDDMETSLYGSLFIKALVLIVVCAMQCCLFMRMLGKKTIEYKRVAMPI